MIKSASEIEALARTAKDNGGVYFVPAFAGLLAPHWRGDARGLMCGLTAFNTRAHVARAVLESTAFQVGRRSFLFSRGVSVTVGVIFKVGWTLLFGPRVASFRVDVFAFASSCTEIICWLPSAKMVESPTRKKDAAALLFKTS